MSQYAQEKCLHCGRWYRFRKSRRNVIEQFYFCSLRCDIAYCRAFNPDTEWGQALVRSNPVAAPLPTQEPT